MLIFCKDPCVRCPPTPAGGAGLGISPDPNDIYDPFLNLSSEAPDRDLFFGRNYGFLGTPPTGSFWLSSGCVGLCFSTTSQEDADLCAARQNVFCLSHEWPVTDPSGTTIPRPLFLSNAQQCTVTCPDGAPFTFIVQAGQFSAFSQTEANLIAYSYACNKAYQNRLCLSSLVPSGGCLNTPFFSSISASTAHSPLAFTLSSGSLPPGLSLAQTSPTTARISGTPTSNGVYTFSILATDSAGNGMTKQYTISILSIATASPLPDAVKDEPYSATLAVSGTTSGTVHWFAFGGPLPAGLSLNELTGVISGTPTTEQSSAFTIEMRDDTHDCTKDFTLAVVPGGLHFDNLIWDTDPNGRLAQPPPVFQVDFVNVPLGAGHNGHWTGPDFSIDVIAAGFEAEVSNVGVLTYTGPLTNCNLHVNVLTFALPSPGLMQFFVRVYQDSVLVIDLNLGVLTGAPGSYDFPFTVQAGTNSLIEIVNINQMFLGNHVGYNASLSPV